jgi:ribosomal protein S18 acetylase RimI-like enzyme
MARIGRNTVGYIAPSFMEGQWRIGALYVLPEAQGKSVGSLLLKAALDWYNDKHDVYLHVAEYNSKAISFYQKFGFELTGRLFEDDAPADANIPELEMVRRISSS